MLDKLIGAALQGLGGSGSGGGGAGGSPIMNVILQLLMSQMAGGGQQAASGGLGGLLGQVLGGGAGPMAGGRGGDPLGGLLGQVLGGMQGGMQGGRAPGGNPLEALAGAILGGQGVQGGLGGLLSQLQGAGLGRQTDSWVSPGENMAVDPGQLLDAFGRDRMQGLAQQNGLELNEMLSGLSQHLPQVVDQLTPQGRLPQHNELQDMLGALLGGGTRRA